jgi:hypothetical protein
MTFYATPATGAAWIVPKNYTERMTQRSTYTGSLSPSGGAATSNALTTPARSAK